MLYNIKLLLLSKNDRSLPHFMVHKHQFQNDDYGLNVFLSIEGDYNDIWFPCKIFGLKFFPWNNTHIRNIYGYQC